MRRPLAAKAITETLQNSKGYPSAIFKIAQPQEGVPTKPWLCGERTSDGVTEPCRLRRDEGYAIREDESVVSEHKFCVLRGLGQRPNKHETGGFRVNGIRLFSQSGHRFALLAGFLLAFVSPPEL